MILKQLIPARIGFGSAPLGNMFREIREAEALDTVSAAWDADIRYYDTAPFYGAGLAELRLGQALAGRNRRNFVLSTTVGRLVLDEIEDGSDRRLATMVCSGTVERAGW